MQLPRGGPPWPCLLRWCTGAMCGFTYFTVDEFSCRRVGNIIGLFNCVVNDDSQMQTWTRRNTSFSLFFSFALAGLVPESQRKLKLDQSELSTNSSPDLSHLSSAENSCSTLEALSMQSDFSEIKSIKDNSKLTLLIYGICAHTHHIIII